MSKQNFLQKLQEYVPTKDEVKFKERMLAFAAEHDDCFERSLGVGHFTASAWILNKDGSKALLLHHTKLDRWFQLGGHCDGDSDVLNVAVKESQEESGIEHIVPVSHDIFDIDIHLIPENKKEKAHYHYDVRFLLRVAGDQQVIQNRESKELRWIGKDISELPTDNPSVVRMFNKWLARN